MPIKKNHKLGKHTTLLIEFGEGDILIQNSKRDDEHYITFHQMDNGGPIGPDIIQDNMIHPDTDGFKELPVTMLFNKVESIDALIGQLQRLKTA